MNVAAINVQGLADEKIQDLFPITPVNAVFAVEGLLSYAISQKASDIHVDPRPEYIVVRMRVDGIMRTVGQLPKTLHEELISRLKILSGARTDIHNQPQDGRWKASIDESDYNIRISFMPTYYGENAVLRLLPAKTEHAFSFAKLGFNPDQVRIIERCVQNPHGLILVTGPTGSGKTTTLHACLQLKNSEALSIITLEDPVEYEMPGIRQVHVNHTYGVTFAHGLRAALRQDPDVIMVGEIRDSETARVGIHTALTGHLVFSTLHTNSALQAVARLVDMGIDQYLLSSTLKLVIAQRLVRNVCHDCYGAGCYSCRHAGYSGRSVITELCEIDTHMADLISRKEPLAVCEEYARTIGYKPILEDGLEKVEWGVTTREEVLRVLAD